MPYGIEFENIGPCIEFLDACLRNLTDLSLQRSDFDKIYVTFGRWGTHFLVYMEIGEGQFDQVSKLARSPSAVNQTRRPTGHPLTINELLGRVKLVTASAPPKDLPVVVALFNPHHNNAQGVDRAFRRRYTQLLDMGCKQIRIGFIQPSDENYGMTHLFLVGKAGKGFWPPTDRGSEPGDHDYVLTFYPQRPADDCRIYVEWGYEYPYERFERLCDFNQPAPVKYLFVCAAPPPIPRPLDEGQGAGPLWFPLLDRDWKTIFEAPDTALAQMENVDNASSVILDPADAKHFRSALEFRVKRDNWGTYTSADALEIQIAELQLRMQTLEERRRRSTSLRRETLYLAYVFEQEMQPSPGAETPELTHTFARFLDKPYAQLKQLRYGFYPNPSHDGRGPAWHVLVDPAPGSFEQALTSLADEVFIQRQLWREWDLPVYVRFGEDIQPQLEDRGFEPLVRDLLKKLGPEDAQAVLLRTLPGDDKSWQPIFVKGLVPLTHPSCFQFVNDRFSAAILEFRQELPMALEGRLRDCQFRLTEKSQELERQILLAVDERLAQAETKWTAADGRINEVEDQTGKHNEAVTRILGAYDQLPPKWMDFVERVLRCHNELCDPQVTRIKRYQEVRRLFEEEKQKYETSRTDVKQLVRTENSALNDYRTDLASAQREAMDAVNSLEAFAGQAETLSNNVNGDVQRLIGLAKERLASKRNDLQVARQRFNDLQNEIDQLKRDQTELDQKRAEITTKTNEATAQRDQLNRDQTALENEVKNLGALWDQLTTLKDNLNGQRKDHEAGLKKLEADIAEQIKQSQKEEDQYRKSFGELEKKIHGLQQARAKRSQCVNLVLSLGLPEKIEKEMEQGDRFQPVSNHLPPGFWDGLRRLIP